MLVISSVNSGDISSFEQFAINHWPITREHYGDSKSSRLTKENTATLVWKFFISPRNVHLGR